MRYDKLPTHAVQFAPAIKAASAKFSIPEELIWAIVGTESNFEARAMSSAGAIGLMQLMPRTAKELNADPFDPVSNVHGGVAYLRRLLARYGGNLGNALAAYNWGPGNLGQPAKPPGAWPRETQEYVSRVAKHLHAFLGGA